jgi:hypothetical protein
MYRDTEAGKPPLPPALLAMAVLLQGYTGMSDSCFALMRRAGPPSAAVAPSAEWILVSY